MEEPQTSEISAQREQILTQGDLVERTCPLSPVLCGLLPATYISPFTSEAGYWAALVRPGGLYQLLFLAKPWASFPLKAQSRGPGDGYRERK